MFNLRNSSNFCFDFHFMVTDVSSADILRHPLRRTRKFVNQINKNTTTHECLSVSILVYFNFYCDFNQEILQYFSVEIISHKMSIKRGLQCTQNRNNV